MSSAKSYIRDTSNFSKKLKELPSVTQNALLVTAELGSYPNFPYRDGLEALLIKLNQREDKKIPKVGLLEIPRFVLINNYF